MIFFQQRLNNYEGSKLQYMNNNFKTSLVEPHTRERHYDLLLTKIYIWLISECTPNSNFSANHEDNENDQDNENHPDNEKEGN